MPEPASGALARILTVIRDGNADEAILPDLDIIEDALVTDLDGLTGPTRGFQPLRGMPGHPVAYVLVCPNGSCSRRVVRTSPSGERVSCGITGRPLDLVKLPT